MEVEKRVSDETKGWEGNVRLDQPIISERKGHFRRIHCHRTGYHGPQSPGGATAPGSEDGSHRSTGWWGGP